LIYGPDDLFRQKESVIDERGEVSLVVSDLAGEQLCSGSVEHVSPVGFFTGIDA
jgi:hypothetical protein